MDVNAFDKKEVLLKLENGETLTNNEERYYMEHVLNYSKDMIDLIFSIADNKDPNVIID
jgi:hypothetical protein